jgi:predicted O-methyltransferase YrrM
MNKEDVIINLNNFVAARGKGSFVHEEPTKLPTPDLNPNYGFGKSYEHPLQQVRGEIYKFIDVLMELNERKVILQTGSGEWNGTHFLWKMMFEKVITIEIRKEIIEKITYPIEEKDFFIIGDARLPERLDQVKAITDSLDVLFLDSNHDYNLIRDEWVLYSPLVRKGGIIAFHDALSRVNHAVNVVEFLHALKTGELDGKKYEIHTIDEAPEGMAKVGIAYYFVE